MLRSVATAPPTDLRYAEATALVQAIRDPKVELYCPVSLGLRINVAITLGVRTYRERKVYGWDAKEQKAKVL